VGGLSVFGDAGPKEDWTDPSPKVPEPWLYRRSMPEASKLSTDSASDIMDSASEPGEPGEPAPSPLEWLFERLRPLSCSLALKTFCISEVATEKVAVLTGTIKATKFRAQLLKLVWLKIGSPMK